VCLELLTEAEACFSRTNLGTKASGKADPSKMTWRRGLTPGSEFIVYSEQISVTKVPGLAPVYYHENGVALTAYERQWFYADAKRDADAVKSLPSLSRAEKSLNNSEDRLNRAQKLLDAKVANPGKFVDPKLFGL
jgi:hypothetical protein